MSFMLGAPKDIFSFMCTSTNALSPTARCTYGAFSLFGKCVDGVLREKNEDLRPFSKVDELVVYPYYLGEVEFGS